MSIFKILDGLIDDIHSLMAQFWRGSSRDNRKIHWLSWLVYVSQNHKGVWGSETLNVLTKRCWRSRFGDFMREQTRNCLLFLKLDTSKMMTCWQQGGVLTRASHGEVFGVQNHSSKKVWDGELAWVGQSMQGMINGL